MTTGNDIKNNPIKYAKLALIVVAVIIIIVIAVNAAGGLNAIVNKIKSALGIGGPAADQALSAREKIAATDPTTTSSSPWSPEVYINRPSNAVSMSDEVLRIAASNIASSVSFIGWLTDASNAYAAIKTLRSKSDVSHLVAIFQNYYNEDLYTYMTKNFSSDYNVQVMAQIIDYVNSLPVYKTN